MYDAHIKYIIDRTPLYSETVNNITYQICKYDENWYTEYYIDERGRHRCSREDFEGVCVWLGSCILHDKKSKAEREVFPSMGTIHKYMKDKIKGIIEAEDSMLKNLGLEITDELKEKRNLGW